MRYLRVFEYLKPGGYLTWEERKLCDGKPVMGGDLSLAAFSYFLFKASFAACVCSSTLLLYFHLPVFFSELITEQGDCFTNILRSTCNSERRSVKQEENQNDSSCKSSRNVINIENITMKVDVKEDELQQSRDFK